MEVGMRCHRGLILCRLRWYMRYLHRNPGEMGLRRMLVVRVRRISHRHQAMLPENVRLRRSIGRDPSGVRRLAPEVLAYRTTLPSCGKSWKSAEHVR